MTNTDTNTNIKYKWRTHPLEGATLFTGSRSTLLYQYKANTNKNHNNHRSQWSEGQKNIEGDGSMMAKPLMPWRSQCFVNLCNMYMNVNTAL